MKVKVIIQNWSLKTVEGTKKIVGRYNVMCGTAEIASQDFNDGYADTIIIFPSKLLVEVEAIGKKIEDCIVQNFIGEE